MPAERRLDHFARRRRDHEEREPAALEAALEQLDERRNVAAQPHPPARLPRCSRPHAAKLGIVADQIGQLAALLDEVAAGQARDLLLEPDARSAR